MTEIEIEMLKIIRSQLITSEARLFDHVSTTFRWLMATLFAANGGAIIAVLGSTQSANVSALGWFAAGLVLSILMGILSCIWAFRAISGWCGSPLAFLAGIRIRNLDQPNVIRTMATCQTSNIATTERMTASTAATHHKEFFFPDRSCFVDQTVALAKTSKATKKAISRQSVGLQGS